MECIPNFISDYVVRGVDEKCFFDMPSHINKGGIRELGDGVCDYSVTPNNTGVDIGVGKVLSVMLSDDECGLTDLFTDMLNDINDKKVTCFGDIVCVFFAKDKKGNVKWFDCILYQTSKEDGFAELRFLIMDTNV